MLELGVGGVLVARRGGVLTQRVEDVVDIETVRTRLVGFCNDGVRTCLLVCRVPDVHRVVPGKPSPLDAGAVAGQEPIRMVGIDPRIQQRTRSLGVRPWIERPGRGEAFVNVELQVRIARSRGPECWDVLTFPGVESDHASPGGFGIDGGLANRAGVVVLPERPVLDAPGRGQQLRRYGARTGLAPTT